MDNKNLGNRFLPNKCEYCLEPLTFSWNHNNTEGKDNSVVTVDFKYHFISLQWLQKCKLVQWKNLEFSFSNFAKLQIGKWILFIFAEYIFGRYLWRATKCLAQWRHLGTRWPSRHFSQSDAWDLSLVSNLSFMILVSPRFLKNDVNAAGPKISWRVTFKS
jgi:hypothetical protein